MTGDGTATDTDIIAITVNPVNDAPALNLDADSSTTGGVDYLTAFTDGGPAVAIVDTDVLITDSDDIELTSATVTLTNPDTNDVLLFNGAPPAGITASLYDPVTGVLTLTGTASLAAYQAALQQITFANTGTNPSTETRIIDVVVNDGTVASNLAHAIVEVTQVNNSAPTLDLDGNNTTLPGTSYSTTFTENGPPVAIADTDTLIGDPDIGGAIASATITLTNPQIGDLLTVTLPLPGGITASAYDPVTGTLTLSNVASFADYETALEAIRFSAAGDNPVAGTRIIQVVVNDGINNSQPATSLVTVVAVNDAPVNAVPGAQSVAEDAILPIAGVSVADIDSSALTTTLSVANGILNVTAGAGVTGNGSASVTITGTAAQINAALAGLTYTGNPNFNGADTLTVATGDGTAIDTDTIAITVNPVNDAPINTVPAAQSVAEDTTLPIAGVSVADIDSSALITTLNVSSGILNVTAGAGVTGNGSASVTIAGTAAEINAALAGLAYTGNLNFNGADTLTVATSDGTATDTDTIAITVNPVNDAPVNTVPGAQSVAEDTILPIAGVSVADIDSSALTTTLSVAHGILNVTAGAGVSGNGSASVTITGTAAQINAALAGLAYTGNLNFNGADTLTVATNDGAAIDTDTIAITVNPVNDAPVNTVPAAQSVAEDTILPIAGVSVADIDSSALTTTLNVSSGILNVTAGAGVTGNGSASVSIAGTAAQINAALAGLAYTGNLNFNGGDTLTVVTSDGTATDTDTIAITVNPVNDAPVLNLDADSSTTGGVDYLTTFVDGGPAVAIVDTDVSVIDIDSPNLVSATITLTNPHAGDSLTVDTPPLPGGIAASVYDSVTGVLTLTGAASAADYQAALLQIRFDAGTNPSTETRIIDVVVNDGTVASNLAHAIVEVVDVNNSAPTLDLDGNNTTLPGTSYRTTFTENGPPVAIADTDTLIGDPDIGSTDIASATITLTNPQIGDLLTAGPLPPTITVDSSVPGVITLSGIAPFADYETALEAIRFSAAGDNPVAGTRIIQVVVNDGINNSQPATSFVKVVAVNDAPVNAVPGAQSVAEDALLPIAGVSVADIDSSALTTTLSVANGILNVTAGAGVSGNGSASVTIAGTAAQINAALAGLAYTGNLNFNGGDTLTVVTGDGTATDTDTIAITVNPVNDAPVNTVPAAQSVAEDTTLPIAGVSVADIDSSALTTTLNVSSGILNVTAGTGAVVTDNGTASVSIAGTAAQINAALAGLTYTGNPDFNGADTLTVVTNDGTATDTDTIAITVNPVNDAPVNTVPAAQSVAEDTILPIAGVSVADIDSSALTTTLSVAHGILNVTAGAGVSGNGSASVSITGTAVQINAALAGLTYTGNLNFNGADTLTVATDDGAAIDTDTIAITVNPVNDAPINSVPAAQSVAEDAILPIAGVSVADIDSSALTTTLNVSSGILNVTAGAGVSGNGSASVTITGTAAQINAALAGLAYTGNLNFNGGDTLTVVTGDGTATDTDTIAITVNPVNDAPVLNLDANSSTTGGADYLTTFTDGGPAVAIVDTDVSVIDNDSPNLVSATITLTNLHAGDV